MEITYDNIGTNYNLTRKADPFLTQQLIQLLKPTQSGNYLDIGCGTGNYTSELQKKGSQWIGIDPSKQMLEKAKLKNDQVLWKLGSAENIGLAENFVDGIIGFLTIHHWTHLESGFLQLNKVLKPQGRIVIFTSTPKQMNGYWLNHYFPKMLSDSILQMPTLERIETAMKDSGIELVETVKYFVKPDLKDQFLYCGKHEPKLYFDDQIRHGISSFSSLANRTEVDHGLSELKKDMASGKINEIIQSYNNNFGDYVFVVGKNQ